MWLLELYVRVVRALSNLCTVDGTEPNSIRRLMEEMMCFATNLHSVRFNILDNEIVAYNEMTMNIE